MQMAILLKDISPPVINMMVCPADLVRIWRRTRLKVVQAGSFLEYFEVILAIRYFSVSEKQSSMRKNCGNLQPSCENKLSEQSSREISSFY